MRFATARLSKLKIKSMSKIKKLHLGILFWLVSFPGSVAD
jgi:hypothetical protein